MKLNPLKWSANTWLLVILGVVLAGTVAPYVVKPSESGPPPEDAAATAPKVGDPAPPFSLADSKGQAHSLDKFQGQGAILTFFCGCSRCQLMAQAFANMQKSARRKRRPLPPIVVVATFSAETEASWKRRSGLGEALYLYDPMRTVVQQWQGEPCPRTFVLDPDLKVEFATENAPMEPLVLQSIAVLADHFQVPEVIPGGDPGKTAPAVPSGPRPAPLGPT